MGFKKGLAYFDLTFEETPAASVSNGSAPATGGGVAVEANPAPGGEKGTNATGTVDATKNQSTDPAKGDGQEGDQDKPKEPTPTEKAAAAAVKAELAKAAALYDLEGDFSTFEEISTALEAREADSREEELTENAGTVFTETMRDVAKLLDEIVFDNVFDDDGDEVTITLTAQQKEAISQRVKNAFNGIRTRETQATFDMLEDAISKRLPKEGHEPFAKDLDRVYDAKGKVSVNDWLDAAIEHGATSTKVWKTREAEHEAAAEKRYSEGFDDGVSGKKVGQASADAGAGKGRLTGRQLKAMTDPNEVAALFADPSRKEELAAALREMS